MHTGWEKLWPVLETLSQVALFCVVWLMASQISTLWLPAIPASMLGMIIMLAALWFNWLPEKWYGKGAHWLLTEMLLFFIPAVVAIIQYPDLILTSGIRIVLVIAISTMLVMGVTGWVVDRCYRLELIWQRKTRRKSI